MKLLCSTDVNCYHLFLSILVQLLICFLLSLTFPPKVFFPPFFKNGFFFMFSLSFQPTLINFSNKFIGCWTTSWCTWRKSIWGYLFVPCTQVPGFRPGKKIPENILINYIGKQYVQQAAVESILKRTLPHAMSSVCNTVSNNFHFCTLIKQDCLVLYHHPEYLESEVWVSLMILRKVLQLLELVLYIKIFVLCICLFILYIRYNMFPHFNWFYCGSFRTGN